VTPTVRSDNGLVFTARRFRAACRDYPLGKKLITPYTAAERPHRTLLPQPQRGVRLAAHFASFADARATIGQWIRFYNEPRPLRRPAI